MHLHKSFHFFNSILFNSLSLLKIILKVSLGVYNLQCIRMLRIPRPNCDVTLYQKLSPLDDSVNGLGHPREEMILDY